MLWPLFHSRPDVEVSPHGGPEIWRHSGLLPRPVGGDIGAESRVDARAATATTAAHRHGLSTIPAQFLDKSASASHSVRPKQPLVESSHLRDGPPFLSSRKGTLINELPLEERPQVTLLKV